MENSDLVKMIDQERWLLNNGLISDSVKNQLFFCGSIVHKDVQAVELEIHSETKSVDYIIYVEPKLLKKIQRYKLLSTATNLFDMWRFKRLLKKEGCLDFERVLGTFINDFCGPRWKVKVVIFSFDTYTDRIEAADGDDDGDRKTN